MSTRIVIPKNEKTNGSKEHKVEVKCDSNIPCNKKKQFKFKVGKFGNFYYKNGQKPIDSLVGFSRYIAVEECGWIIDGVYDFCKDCIDKVEENLKEIKPPNPVNNEKCWWKGGQYL